MHGFEKYKDSLPPEFYRRIKNLYDGREDIKTLPELKAYWLWVIDQRNASKDASSYIQGQIAGWGRSAIEPTSIFPKIHQNRRLELIHDEFASLEWPWLGNEASDEENKKYADAQWDNQKRQIELM